MTGNQTRIVSFIIHRLCHHTNVKLLPEVAIFNIYIFSIIFAVIIGFLGTIAKLSDICFSCLAKFPSSFSHSRLKIILKQLLSSGSVNIAEYLQ